MNFLVHYSDHPVLGSGVQVWPDPVDAAACARALRAAGASVVWAGDIGGL